MSFWDNGVYGGTLYYYVGGTLSIYRDPSRNADLAVASTFSDGDLILRAALFEFNIDCSTLPESDCPPAILESDLQFTDGTLFARVSQDGIGFLGNNHGPYAQDNISPQVQTLGYFAQAWTRIDILVPTPVLPVTWGNVKARYGNVSDQP